MNHANVGALIITYTILGVPYYNDCLLGPKTYGPCIIASGFHFMLERGVPTVCLTTLKPAK